MATNVGGIFYDVTLDTSKMIDGQRAVGRELDKTESRLAGFSASLKTTAAAVGILVVAMSAAAIKSAQMADDMRMLAVRVNIAAGSVEAGAVAMSRLEDISRKTQTSVSANVSLFARLNSSIVQMGGSQSDTLIITELLSKAIKIGGASAVEASSAILQLGQALGSGKLAGDELRSLMENAPYLMKQLAEGIGVPVGALKSLGEQGKLTSDVVVAALGRASSQIDSDFSKIPQTLSGAFQAAEDAANRANQKLDELTGTSAALTGITKGLGEVLDDLAGQFGAANDQAGALGANNSIESWATTTRKAISYVIDAGDIVTRVFRGMGTGLAGLTASAAAAMSGDLKGASSILGMMSDDINKISNAPLAGKNIRDLIAQGAGGGRGRINPQAALSELKTPQGAASKAGGAGKRQFDSAGYLATLKKAAADELGIINATEAEATRIADKHYAAKEISAKQHEEALTLIRAAAGADRAALEDRLSKDARDKRESDAKDDLRAAVEISREISDAKAHSSRVIGQVDPAEALRMEYESKLAIVVEYEQLMAAAGIEATEQAQAARTQIEAEYGEQRRLLAEQTFASQSEANAFMIESLNALAGTATTAISGLLTGTMSAQDAMRSLAGVVLNEAVGALVQIGIQQIKNALIGDAIFAADKAKKVANGAIYTASVSAQVAGMSSIAAMNAFAATAAIPIVGPALAPAAAAAAAAASAALGAPAIATAPIAGARRYGGPTSAGSMYRVNESGRPEMFTASNGSQYMIPTANGRVTSADKVGDGGGWTVIINNNGQAMDASVQSVDQSSRTVTLAVNEVARQISSNTGPVFGALRSATNTQGRVL